MAEITQLTGDMTLREMYPTVNANVTKVNAEIVGHKSSQQAHAAAAITYSGEVAGAANVKDAIDNVKNEVRTIVAHAGDGTKDTEIILARADAPTLGDRLDGINAQLADTEQKVASKAEESDLIATNYQVSSLQSRVDGLDRGWGGTFPTLSALQSAQPLGDNKRYVVAENNHWYYWNGNAWTDGGPFQNNVLGENSVDIPNLVEGAVSVGKASFLESKKSDITPNIVYISNCSVIPNGAEVIIDPTVTSEYKSLQIPLVKNAWYTIEKSPSNRFRLVMMDVSMVGQTSQVVRNISRLIANDDNQQSMAFYSGDNQFAVLFYSNTNQTITARAYQYSDSKLKGINVERESIEDGQNLAMLKTAGFPFPQGLVAFWDFSEDKAPYYSKAGVDKFPLNLGGTQPEKRSIAPFGGGAFFNGATDYLQIDAANVGALNCGKVGDEVTVVAWVRPATVQGFIAGMWQEDDNDPKRQYGMFVNLPMYGGEARVNGHISKTGRPSPGLIYSRDYSSSGMALSSSKLRCIAMTYDGKEAKSYIDGVCDERPIYHEPSGPTYAKNPYEFDLGLNRGSISNFTVGAVRLTNGMGNFFNGTISGLAIFDRALSQNELMKLHLASLTVGDPIQHYDFKLASGVSGNAGDYGWFAAQGSDAYNCSYETGKGWYLAGNAGLQFAALSASNDPTNTSQLNMIEKTGLRGLKFSQIAKVRFTLNNTTAGNSVKLCIKVGEQWYCTASDYSHAGNGSLGDWSTAEIKNITVTKDKSQWLELNYKIGEVLSIGTAPISDISNEEVNGVGILANPLASSSSVIRLREFYIYS